MSDSPSATVSPAEKVKQFPTGPGLYLMKDAPGTGDLHRQGQEPAQPGQLVLSQDGRSGDRRICDWIGEVADIEFLAADSEVDALLMEARLVKDIQPKYNRDLKDDKTFPYLQITTGEDFPRVNFTREPLDRGVKLYGPFPRAKSLRGAIQVLQRIFKFRTCSLEIEEDDPRWRWFRPCLLASINQCTAPCNLRIDRESYRADIRRLQMFLDGKKDMLAQGDGRGDARGEQGAPVREGGPAARRDQGAGLSQLAGQSRRARSARGVLRRSAQGAEGLEADLEARLDSAHDRRRGHRPPGRQRRWLARWWRSSTACRSSRAIADTRSRAWRASTTSRRSAKSSPGASRACKSAMSRFPTSG